MSFRSVDEIGAFSFRDAVLSNFERGTDSIVFHLDALIVREDNSQNTNYTESYADTTVVRLEQGTICHAVQEGYKYYDANDVLIENVPDRELSVKELKDLLRELDGAFLFAMKKTEGGDKAFTYSLGIEGEGDGRETASYWIDVTFEHAIFSWDRYMNRVQH